MPRREAIIYVKGATLSNQALGCGGVGKIAFEIPSAGRSAHQDCFDVQVGADLVEKTRRRPRVFAANSAYVLGSSQKLVSTERTWAPTKLSNIF